MSLLDSLAHLNAKAALVYQRHAGRADVQGNWTEFFHLWQRAYEATAANREQNPVFAATLLPGTVPVAVPIAGLPSLPAGVRVALDDPTPGGVSLAIDLAGTITLQVLSPTGTPVASTVTPGAVRQTASFLASVDGLYSVAILVNGSRIATVYVPVQRVETRRFREQSRALALAFAPGRRPKNNEDYMTRLALLIACNAAAATGQPALYAQLADEAVKVPAAKTPVALFPYHGHP